MIAVTKPYAMNGTYTILDAFDVKEKIEDFTEVLQRSFFNFISSDAIFKTGCDRAEALAHARVLKDEFYAVSVSTEPVGVLDVRDVLHGAVFNNDEKLFGWLIFIDDMPLANWGHECKYLFFHKRHIIIEAEMFYPPATFHKMELMA